MVSKQNESAHFATTIWILKKGKLYIQANLEIFCDILWAGCHRCVLRFFFFFFKFLDLKEKEKKSFHFSEQHQHRAEKPVGCFLPHFVPPVNLWQNLCPCCTGAFFCWFLSFTTQLPRMSAGPVEQICPPPRGLSTSGTFWSKSEIPRRVAFAHWCAFIVMFGFICNLQAFVLQRSISTSRLNTWAAPNGRIYFGVMRADSIVYIFIAMKRVLIDQGVLRVAARISEFIVKWTY